ncbi:MAG: UDP-glucose 4-epimerase [Solirubrobacteraceae bacterium]|jgi:UDP-glucose 4-epimerase|nr:UDP-glucose 4-epimerase [Solirubrobacteraceae bacterium]
MKKVLVTGGAGFIGSHVVDRLRERGHRPRIFDLVPSPYHEPSDVESVVGDLLDVEGLRVAMHGCHAVMHLAAMADADAVAQHPGPAESANVRGTLNVLDAARGAGVRRVLYASTIWVYSDVEAPLVDEETPLPPPAHLYTATKLAGELYCHSFAELYGLEYTILRFGIPYGPRARPAAVVPTFVNKALAGEPLTIAGSGGQSRRFVYVEDLAEGVVSALAPQAANRVFNLVGTEDVTIREVAENVREAVGGAEIVSVPARNADFRGVEVSAQRAAGELGWNAATPFSEGVRRYVDWHRADADRAAAAAPARVPARTAPAGVPETLRGLARGVARAAPLAGASAVLALLFETLHLMGTAGDNLRTVAVTSLLGLVLYLALSSDVDRPQATFGAARLGWLVVGAIVAVVLQTSWDSFRLVSSDLDRLVFSTLGAGLGAATAAASRRIGRGRWEERASTSGS